MLPTKPPAKLKDRSKTAVVCLSSGLDSSLALQLAIDEGYAIRMAITFDYGQRAFTAEARQSKTLADFFHTPHRIIALPWFSDLTSGGGLLNTEAPLPQIRADQLDDAAVTAASAKAVWIPNRNGVMIEVAAGIAEDQGCDSVVVGFNREEAKTFPDNSEAYLSALNGALFYSTSRHITVISPTAKLNKTEIVEIGMRRGFPFHLVWSCYQAGEKMCGLCESCLRLARALDSNQVRTHGFFSNPHP